MVGGAPCHEEEIANVVDVVIPQRGGPPPSSGSMTRRTRGSYSYVDELVEMGVASQG